MIHNQTSRRFPGIYLYYPGSGIISKLISGYTLFDLNTLIRLAGKL